MFSLGTDRTPRAQPKAGMVLPLTLPYRGMNALAPYSVMNKDYAITLVNVFMEEFGLRTRKGFSEWATTIPGIGAIRSILIYYPAAVGVALMAVPDFRGRFSSSRPKPQPMIAPPVGNVFAARGGLLYDITAGGAGPWTAEVGIGGPGGGDYWTSVNFQNLAGSFLCVTNDDGGYHFYDGTNWVTPVAGILPGQIDGVNPANLCFVAEIHQRLWFVEKNSTRAWYLPVNELTGVATMFDFGQYLKHGGPLAVVANWTVDSGSGINDHVVGIGYEGDVVIYQGFDPDDPTNFEQMGTWFVGALPFGRRQVSSGGGGDLFILSQVGLVPLSRIQASASMAVIMKEESPTYLIGPLISKIMKDFGRLPNWQTSYLLREELIVIGLPREAIAAYGEYFAYRDTHPSWSIIADTGWSCFGTIGNYIFAGTDDGRVVLAFNGVLDDVDLAGLNGEPINCIVTPAFQRAHPENNDVRVTMIRPVFVTSLSPTLTFSILTDYSVADNPIIPTIPPMGNSVWGVAIWDAGIWSGVRRSISRWLGASGVGFAVTVQLDYRCGGDTVLSAIDFWVVPCGSPM